MAAPDATKVSSMKPLATGGVLVAPFGSTLPPETAPSGSVSIDEAFVALGYLSKDDNVNNSEEINSEDIHAWGGALVLSVSSERKESYSFTPIEQNITVWKLRYGTANVSGTDANASIIHDGKSFEEFHSIIIAEKLTDGRVHLTVIPKAKLESVDDNEHADDDAFGYGMSFTALAYSGDKTSYDLYYTPSTASSTTSG